MSTWKKLATAIYLSGAFTVLQNCKAVIAQATAPAVEKCEEVIEELVADWNNFLDPLSEPQLDDDEIYIVDGYSSHDRDLDQGPTYNSGLRLYNDSNYAVAVNLDTTHTVSNCSFLETSEVSITESYTLSANSSTAIRWTVHGSQPWPNHNCYVDIDVHSLDITSVTKSGSIDNKDYSVTFTESEQEYPELTGSGRATWSYHDDD